MMKMKLNKKIAGASAMLLLSTTMLGTSTFAWFTMNKTVSVTGMEMKTKVSGNLLICDNNVESDFSTAQLSQTRKALLEPVSSISGADGSFWYTVNAKGNGDAVEDVYTAYSESTSLTGSAIDLIDTSSGHPVTSGAGKEKVDAAFNTGAGSYGISTYATTAATAYDNAYGYVDYVFFLKATGDADTQIKMTKCNLLYNDAAIVNTGDGKTVGDNVDRAWRAAVFCSEAPARGTIGASNASAANLKAILTLADATNQTANMAVNSGSAAPVTLSPIATYNTWSDNTNKTIATVNAKETNYFKVTIRVWLEGEDTTCTSKTYAALDGTWKLDAEFTLGNSATAVTNIGSVLPANNNNNNSGN